jgi:four helix bundle protein
MTMKNNVIKDKSYAFALEIIDVCTQLIEQKHFVLSNQLLKSGTSIGANVRESQSAESNKDFTHKLNIALKESHETDYWLHLIMDSKVIDSQRILPLINKNDDITKILSKIILTMKKKLK